ncbi:CapA family protein [Tissierella sp.]|uniref:CapA family protein n=1 Tax=Tissierella sp. TaxID=41274 RepID=UPI0028641AC4|nr:CapA family protein [Tissierella sp.]MDR7855599.1 CapA family protein [Tissierella sp.]
MNRGVYLFFLLTMFSNLLPIESKGIHRFEKEKTVLSRQEVNTKDKYIISIVGDILMDGSVRGQIDRNGIGYPWEMVEGYFQDDDITIGNLETSITNGGTKWEEKQYNFRSDPKNLAAMKDASIDVVTLANNHTLDYGIDGFLDTLNHIDKGEIKRAGGGSNRKEAMEGVIIEKENIKFGILSFSRVVPDVKWYATSKGPGIVGAYDSHIEGVVNQIIDMKKEVDIVLVSIHWGVELSTSPRKEEMDLAKKLVDAGADIIMGHHPHVLQGIEIYNGKPIFYSLGNFVFGSKNELTASTMIAQINIIDKAIDNVKIIPCTIVMGRPTPVEEDKKAEKIKYINTISNNFNTKISNEGIIKINQ